MSRSSSSLQPAGGAERSAGGDAPARDLGGETAGTFTGAADLDAPLDRSHSSGGGSGGSGGGGGGGAHGVLFPPGVLVGGRYLVARFIARGGMGEVYEAEDVALRERIALKVVRSETASDPRASERLKRELHLARKVSHPNVCRIYDLCFHELTATGETVPVLTMELLQGETLGARIRRTGALPLDEVLAMARQIAAALDAAHDQGIVHRDLKADNIFLVPGRRAGETRVVVTDFGLARGGDGAAITQGSGRLIGSPAYMAPEQVEGGHIGPAADLYAFGVVLYELCTGERPFEGESIFEVAFKRLQRAPDSPRLRRPELPAAWEGAILRLLARRPEERFASAQEAIEAMVQGGPAAAASSARAPESSRRTPTEATTPRRVERRAAEKATPPADPTPPETPRSLVRRVWRRLGLRGALAAATAALLLLRCSGAFDSDSSDEQGRVAEPAAPGDTADETEARPAPRPAPPPLPAMPARLREAVAVLGFKNVAGRAEKAWLNTALQQMLSSELAVGQQLRLVSDESVARARAAMTLPDEPSLAADTLRRLRAVLGSDFVVRGSYVTTGAERIHLEVVLQDARSGETVARVAGDGTETELSTLASSVGQKLRARLGVMVTPSEASEAVARMLPSSTAAERLYAEGMASLRRWEANAARQSLEGAVAADPEFPLAHAALAEALLELGFQEKARAAAKRAFELSGKLDPENQLAVAGRYHAVLGNKDEAVATYGKLFGLHPDDLEHGLELATAECNALHERDALATLEQLRRLPPPSGTDPRIDVLTAHVDTTVGEYDRARKVAQLAAGKAREQQNWTFVAEARLIEGRAAMMLGDPDAARVAMLDARAAYSRASDRHGQANVLYYLSSLHLWIDDLNGAVAHANEYLKVVRSLGNRSMESKILQVQAMHEMLRGDLPAARQYLEKQASLESQMVAAGEKANDDDRRRIDGMLLAIEGQLEPSRRSWEPLRAKYSPDELPSPRSFVDTQLGMVLIEQDEIEDATEFLREAEQLAAKTRDQRRIALARYYLAQAAMAQDHFAEAERNARSAADVFAQIKAPAAATACALLADAAQAKLGRAEEALADVRSRLGELPRMQPFEWRVIATLAAARVLAHAPAEGAVEANRLASGAVAESSRAGFAGLALESRLALGEIELVRGNTEGGKALLASLAADAETRGYERVQHRAEELLEGKAGGKAGAARARRAGAATEVRDLSDLPRILRKVQRELPAGFGRDVMREVERSSRSGKLRDLIEQQAAEKAARARDKAARARDRAAHKAGGVADPADEPDNDPPDPPDEEEAPGASGVPAPPAAPRMPAPAAPPPPPAPPAPLAPRGKASPG